MMNAKPGLGAIEQDAVAIEDKFGPFAEVYAENRSQAAELAGDEVAGEHWKKVEEALGDEG